MEKHIQLLPRHCRICANKLDRVEYSSVKHSTLLEEAFGVSVVEDEPEVHPPNFCNKCYLTAKRVSKSIREGKYTETNCRPQEWSSHSDNCKFCNAIEDKQHGGRPKKRRSAGRPSLVMHHIKGVAGKRLGGGNKLYPDIFVELESVDIKNLLCCVCNMIVDCPVEVSCGHLICMECCLHECTTEFCCPFCECTISSADKTSFSRVASALQQLLEGLQLHCPVCHQLTHLGKLVEHQQSSCKTHTHVHEPTAHDIISQPASTPPTALEQRAAAGILQRMLALEGERVVALPTGGRVSHKQWYTNTLLIITFSHLTF